jgi:hypothetical protein
VLNVFVASVRQLALTICLLAPSEMRCYICDGSGSPLPRRAWQREAPGHPTSAPSREAVFHDAALRRGRGGIAAKTASVL